MASMFTHGFVALTGAAVVSTRAERAKFMVLSTVSSILPDADVIGFRFDVDYGSLCGHRGLSHSLFFAALWSLALVRFAFPRAAFLSRGWWKLWAWIALMMASHGLFDGMSDGGLGIAFFSPFDTTRYFLPWRPILVSPIGVANFFNEYGLRVLLSEIVAVWIPWSACLALFVLARWRRARTQANSTPR